MRTTLRQAILASTFLAFGGVLAGGASAAPNDAAPAAPVTPAAPMPAATPAPGKSGTPDARSMQQRVEKRIADLHAALHVTAAQQPQWDAFAAVMRDNAQHMDSALISDASGLGKMTAVDQMKTYAAITDQHAKDMASLVPAFQTLYDAMTPEQKLNADKYFRAQAEHNRHGKKG